MVRTFFCMIKPNFDLVPRIPAVVFRRPVMDLGGLASDRIRLV